MAWRFHGKANVDPEQPAAFAVCDRCARWWNHRSLRFQYDWRGNRLMSLWILVCEECYDLPQPQLRPKPVPPDPTPVIYARPEPFSYDNVGESATASVAPPDFNPPILDE